MSEQLYLLYLDDPSCPGFCSFDRMYFGTLDDMSAAFAQVTEHDPDDLLPSWMEYLAGNRDVEHYVAYRKERLLTPVELIDSEHFSPGKMDWAHINTWGFPYFMNADDVEVSQILVRHDGSYYRAVRAKMKNLTFHTEDEERLPVQDGLWGNAFTLKIERRGKDRLLSGLLYTAVDVFTKRTEAKNVLHDISKISLDVVCDEIFGDG